MTDQPFILAPATASVQVRIALEPDYNVLNSLSLLSYPEERSGFSEWVTRTAAKLSPDRDYTHRLIFKTMFSALEPYLGHTSFPAYLDALETANAEAMRDHAIAWICKRDREHHHMEGIEPLEKEVLLNDRSAYLNFIERVYAKKGVEKEGTFEPSYFVEAHALFNDPVTMKKRVVSHLREMWEEIAKPEWERVVPMLQESVDAFQQLDFSRMTGLEAVRVVTGRDVSSFWENWPETIIFIPSAHIGPYITRYDNDAETLARVLFGARQPEGARVSSPALSRSELLVRLNALADDTRLMILELLTQHDELCAQDVIEMLNLSQSAASRHLRQLTATGYLVERRREVAKCYSLNPQRVDDTLRALKRFLHAK